MYTKRIQKSGLFGVITVTIITGTGLISQRLYFYFLPKGCELKTSFFII